MLRRVISAMAAVLSVSAVSPAAAQTPSCPLAAPVITSPIEFTTNPTRINWRRVGDAAVYAVYILNAASKEVVVAGATTTSTAYETTVPPGPYAAVVYAYHPACGGTGSEPALFIVDHRIDHEAALLPDGRVLTAGGWGLRTPGTGRLVPSAETFDPSALAWSPAGFTAQPRSGHTMTVLPDGRILSAGGNTNPPEPASNTAEVYAPASNQWTAVAPMLEGREDHAAAPLLNGRLLVTGGTNGVIGGEFASAEIFDPATDLWTAASAMREPRFGHSATLLADGRVLVAGGVVVTGALQLQLRASAEVYDPSVNTWSDVGSMTESRYRHVAMRLADGRVLVAGGTGPGYGARASGEVFDPVTNTWSPAGSMSGMGLDMHAGVALDDGRAIVIGGRRIEGSLFGGGTFTMTPSPWVHLYNPQTNSWSLGPSLPSDRKGHTATLAHDGRVVVAGGESDYGPLKRVDIFDPVTDTWLAVEDPWTILP
jgi:N-acetylneuraminic acid mutarotase